MLGGMQVNLKVWKDAAVAYLKADILPQHLEELTGK
jgi:hypothetical protein